MEREGIGDEGGSGKNTKRLSVERIYQRKTQLEHILLRPDTYVGSTEETTEQIFVFDSEKEAILKRNVTFVPGLYKIYDEILGMFNLPLYIIYTHVHRRIYTYIYTTMTVNAADNKQRDSSMKAIKIVIDPYVITAICINY